MAEKLEIKIIELKNKRMQLDRAIGRRIKALKTDPIENSEQREKIVRLDREREALSKNINRKCEKLNQWKCMENKKSANVQSISEKQNDTAKEMEARENKNQINREKKQENSIFDERIKIIIKRREKLQAKLAEKELKIAPLEWSVREIEQRLEREKDDLNYARGERECIWNEIELLNEKYFHYLTMRDKHASK